MKKPFNSSETTKTSGRFSSVKEFIGTLTEDEKEQFKDLIEESLKREEEIKDNRKASFENLQKIKQNMSLLNTEFNNMVEQLNKLHDALKSLSNKLDTLPKKQDTVFMPPNAEYIKE